MFGKFCNNVIVWKLSGGNLLIFVSFIFCGGIQPSVPLPPLTSSMRVLLNIYIWSLSVAAPPRQINYLLLKKFHIRYPEKFLYILIFQWLSYMIWHSLLLLTSFSGILVNFTWILTTRHCTSLVKHIFGFTFGSGS